MIESNKLRSTWVVSLVLITIFGAALGYACYTLVKHEDANFDGALAIVLITFALFIVINALAGNANRRIHRAFAHEPMDSPTQPPAAA